MSTSYNIKIITHSVNVRTGPSTSNKVFDWLVKDETVTSSKKQNGWYYVDSLKGWITGNSKYISVQTVASKKETPVTKPNPTTTKTTDTTTTKTTSSDEGAVVVKQEIKKTQSINLNPEVNASSKISSVKINTSTASAVYNGTFIEPTSKTRNPKYNRLININSRGEYTGADSNFASKNGIANFSEYNFDRDLGSRADFVNLESALKNARSEMNVYDEDDIPKLFSKMNRFKIGMPNAHLHKAYPYIFFTRPDIDVLNDTGGAIKGDVEKVGHTLSYLFNDSPKSVKSLTRFYSDNHSFNVFLSNMARSFEPQDEVIRTVETGETYTGWKTVYARNSNESNSSGQFNIQYRDTNNLDILKMHKAWIEYMNLVYKGILSPPRDYIMKKILNYACSVYVIICAEDGESIITWSKYYGVFPINIPLSNLGWSAGSPIKMQEFNISYMYALKDDYDPITLIEFNQMSHQEKNYLTIFNESTLASSESWAGMPYVDFIKKKDGAVKYKLRFRS